MSLSNRYLPSHPQGQTCQYALDFSNLLPPGVGIQTGALIIAKNTVPPVGAGSDFTLGPVTVNGRRLYCQLAGGISATDYQLNWTATDSLGNIWQRGTLLLCAETS